VFGGVLASMGKEAELLIKIFEALNTASVKMIKLVML
jgi:Na+/H+-dicarboxylate symporter